MFAVTFVGIFIAGECFAQVIIFIVRSSKLIDTLAVIYGVGMHESDIDPLDHIQQKKVSRVRHLSK